MRAEEPTSWVVYTIKAVGKMPSINAICSQGEWGALDSSRPGKLTLIRENIDNEGEAERLARTLTPPAPPKPPRPFRPPVAKILPTGPLSAGEMGIGAAISDSQPAES